MIQSIISSEFLMVVFFMIMGFSFLFLSGITLRRVDRVDLLFRSEINYTELKAQRTKKICNLIWTWRFLTLLEIISFITSGYLIAGFIGVPIFGLIVIPEIIRQRNHIPTKDYDPLDKLGESITFTNIDGATPTSIDPKYSYLYQTTRDCIRTFVKNRNLSEDMIEKTFKYLISFYGVGNEILLEVQKEFIGNP